MQDFVIAEICHMSGRVLSSSQTDVQIWHSTSTCTREYVENTIFPTYVILFPNVSCVLCVTRDEENRKL